MKILVRIFLLLILLFLYPYYTGSAQGYIAQADSSGYKSESSENITQDKKSIDNQQQANNGKAEEHQPVKQVKSARPDMSKARGARPAYIQRQSGSGIPKGIGRPGGAGTIKPGKR
jgi:hypothetical protein